MDGACQQVTEQATIQVAELLAQPEARRQGLFDIEAIHLSRIKDEVKAQFDDQQGVVGQKRTELGGVDQALADA
jgi:hypothetical protein